MSDLTERTQAAFADACQEQGRLRRPAGGDVLDLPGIRLWASGLAAPTTNGALSDDPSLVDLGAVEAWFAARGAAWGALVPAGLHWPYGRHLKTKPLMALDPVEAVPGPGVPGVTIRRAEPKDLDAIVEVDSIAFGAEDLDVQRGWIGPHLAAFSITTLVAELDGRAVGTAYGVRSDGRGGSAYSIGGVGVLPEARGRGIAAALSARLVALGLDSGAELVHLSPDTDAAARVYARLGFVEAGALEIYVDNHA